jgi:hypothetical protein
MSDQPLTPANPSEVLFSLSCALTHDGKRRFGRADNLMAALTAHHLLEHLERSGYVIGLLIPFHRVTGGHLGGGLNGLRLCLELA